MTQSAWRSSGIPNIVYDINMIKRRSPEQKKKISSTRVRRIPGKGYSLTRDISTIVHAGLERDGDFKFVYWKSKHLHVELL